jgi:hypothetical protein
MRTPRTKRELLRQILEGPATIRAIYVYSLTTVRVAIPCDPDPNGGIWISFSLGGDSTLGESAYAFAQVGERKVRLTQVEAVRIARFIALRLRIGVGMTDE